MRVTVKKVLIFVTDLVVTFLSYYLSQSMFSENFLIRSVEFTSIIKETVIVTILYSVIYLILKINHYSWKQSSVYEALIVIANNFVVFIGLILAKKIGFIHVFRLGSLFVGFILSTLIHECIRFLYRSRMMVSYRVSKYKNNYKRVLIYGAGEAGRLIVREIYQNPVYEYNLLGFIDDDSEKKGNILSGFRVLGTGDDLPSLIREFNINKIIVAMPSESRIHRSEVIKRVVDSKVESVKVVSSLIIADPTDVNKSLRNVEIKDLLNRKEIKFVDSEIKTIIEGKKVLITGAGGSIGSEIVRQVITHNPKQIVCLDINETGLYQIEQEISIARRLGKLSESIEVIALIGSIRDKQRMNTVFDTYRPNIVFHAAAHKHVPLMETSPKEAIKNNIFGTKNIIDLSIKYSVERFINISTDKAVNPTNVMGATKRFIEMMLQNANSIQNDTIFCAVRFGNVLGSNGSVIPLFKEQIAKGGPVTVTHPEMVRYFMTIPEAVSLVLQAATYANDGEIFVLDMGEPVKIADLAYNLIKLSGYEPNKEIEIKFVGLRPGEKLYEELLMAEEGLQKTANDLIYIAKPTEIETKYINECLEKLSSSLACEELIHVKEILATVVPTYRMEEK